MVLEARVAPATGSSSSVQDDGRGFASASGPGEGHFGLLLMRERARAAGGSLSVDSVPGGGTRVALDLPLGRS